MSQNLKTTEETASNAVADGTELVRAVQDPSGTPVNVKMTTQKIANRAGIPKHALVNGGAAGDITVAAIKSGDRLDEVIQHIYTAGAITSITDLTAEFTIPSDGKINNTGGTATTGNKLMVRWGKRTA